MNKQITQTVLAVGLCLVGIWVVGYYSHDDVAFLARIFLSVAGLVFFYILAITLINFGTTTAEGVWTCSSRLQQEEVAISPSQLKTVLPTTSTSTTGCTATAPSTQVQ